MLSWVFPGGWLVSLFLRGFGQRGHVVACHRSPHWGPGSSFPAQPLEVSLLRPAQPSMGRTQGYPSPAEVWSHNLVIAACRLACAFLMAASAASIFLACLVWIYFKKVLLSLCSIGLECSHSPPYVGCEASKGECNRIGMPQHTHTCMHTHVRTHTHTTTHADTQ